MMIFSYLEDPAALSCIPLQLNSWLYRSRSLTYLLQRSHISVRFPHTSWKLLKIKQKLVPQLNYKD